MVINILKDLNWIKELEPFNEELKRVHKKYIPGLNKWFIPDMYRNNPLNRTYPKIDPVVNYRPEYKLTFYLPNYLPLFLIRELYKDKKDIEIEDVGTGNGNLIYFLAKSGFKHFNTFEVFCECPKPLFDDMMKLAQVECTINDLTTNPVVIHNASAPRFCWVSPGLDKEGKVDTYEDKTYYKIQRDFSNLELICFYSNSHWEKFAPQILEPRGYTFLCRDVDYIGVAWCRNDKIKEFNEKLSRWAV